MEKETVGSTITSCGDESAIEEGVGKWWKVDPRAFDRRKSGADD